MWLYVDSFHVTSPVRRPPFWRQWRLEAVVCQFLPFASLISVDLLIDYGECRVCGCHSRQNRVSFGILLAENNSKSRRKDKNWVRKGDVCVFLAWIRISKERLGQHQDVISSFFFFFSNILFRGESLDTLSLAAHFSQLISLRHRTDLCDWLSSGLLALCEVRPSESSLYKYAYTQK